MQDVQYGEKAEREPSLDIVFLSRTLKSVANKTAVSENLRRTAAGTSQGWSDARTKLTTNFSVRL